MRWLSSLPVAVTCALCSCSYALAAAVGPTQEGLSTFYGGPQDNTSPYVPSFGLLNGACGYQTLQQDQWPYWQAVAIGPDNIVYSAGNKKGCGACIQATCTTGCNANASSVVVWVTDTCSTCGPTQLNIHSLTFAQYFQSNLEVGQVNVQWQQVDCNPPGNIQARVVDYRVGDGGFIAVALLQVAGDGIIAGLDIQSAGQSSWAPMFNDYGAVWQGSNLGSPPFSLRITGSTKEQLIASGAITQLTNGTYPTQVQFGGATAGVLPSPPAQSLPQAALASCAAPPATSASIPKPVAYPPAPPPLQSQPPLPLPTLLSPAQVSIPLQPPSPTPTQPPTIASSPPQMPPPAAPSQAQQQIVPLLAPQIPQIATTGATPAPAPGAASLLNVRPSKSPSAARSPRGAPAVSPTARRPTAQAVTPTAPSQSAGAPRPVPRSQAPTASSPAASPATSPAGSPATSPAASPATSPAAGLGTTPAAAPGTSPTVAPEASPAAAPGLSSAAPVPGQTAAALAPGTTQLRLNVSGSTAAAINGIVNPAITVSAGRRLQRVHLL